MGVFFIFVSLLFTSLMADESFYAISSLTFYLNQPPSSSLFEEEDVERLWSLASESPLTSLIIEEARNKFDNGDKEASSTLLCQAWETLRDQPSQMEPPHFALPFEKDDARISPYLLPKKHALNGFLNSRFQPVACNKSKEKLLEAGFIPLIFSTESTSFLAFMRHPATPGWIYKIPIETETRIKKNRPSWKWLRDRCLGAKNIRKLIKKEKMVHFTVPKKWLYIIPEKQGKPRRHPLLLIATDMNLANEEETLHAYKTKITKAHLNELFSIMSHGYASSYLIGNIPYTKSGKFACVDTEYPKRPNVDMQEVFQYLSEPMAREWERILRRKK